jgi:multidrug efflux pump subunit AcrB
MEKQFKEFKLTSWAVDNRISVYVLAVFISLFGFLSYRSIPKEQFPEIVIPTILVNTVYPGTAPSEMESLVTRPLEKNLKSIKGVKQITSRSIQDFSIIAVEFTTDVVVEDAKQKVKDAVDKTKRDLPSDLPEDPSVAEIDFSEIPIMYINLSGNYGLDKLKKYADTVQDRIEALPEITRVDIVGALDREIQVDVDMFRMQSAHVTFDDIDSAIADENVTVAGGSVDIQGMRRSVSVDGDFSDIESIRNVVLHSASGAVVRLKDIAEVKDGYLEQESYARLDGKNVITLNVIKKSGQNLLEASDGIKGIVAELKRTKFPKDLNVTITGDMSKYTRNTLTDLNNTIIIGFILVVLVLMFFMGLTDAIFVALSVPLSMALAYIVLPIIGYTLNMLVMFSFIFALGIVVDDAIVVIENTHRIFNRHKYDIATSAKMATGEVFVPVLAGTLTTLAPFFPLVFWPGIAGKFMRFIPVTIIITLFASLIVSYVFNPVFAVSFMKSETVEQGGAARSKRLKPLRIVVPAAAVLATALHLARLPGVANFILLLAIVYILHALWGEKILEKFEHSVIPALLGVYERLLRFLIRGRRPYVLLWGVVGLFFATIFITATARPKVVFFPDNEPNTVETFVKLPVGTDVEVTDALTAVLEKNIRAVLGIDPANNLKNPLVESIVTNVALGASEEMFDSGTKTANRAKITVNFVEFAERNGEKTWPYLEAVRGAVRGIPGAEITVDKNRMGPPTGKPINIEISGDDIGELVAATYAFMKYIDSLKIPGIEELKSDFELSKPELAISVDRARANNEGISSGRIGLEVRTAILGREVSKFREGEDQYPIQLRYKESQRNSIDRLMSMKIAFRDAGTGALRQVPLSSVAKIEYDISYGGINRKNLKRVITVSSNVLTGYTPNEIVERINGALTAFEKPDTVDIRLTGEQEEQRETMSFLGRALLLSLCLIMFILITQFNSLTKPLIIVSEVFFSIIGVLLGFVLFDMTISIVMTGFGVIALVGIVVKNGILLIEFTDVLKSRGLKTREAIIQGGKTRTKPVLLTAGTTILGLVPVAAGLNIDFAGLFRRLDPRIHFGGENATFFSPLAWAIIFGLSFATFLTLLLIPSMYYIMYVARVRLKRRRSHRRFARGA